MTVMKIPMCKHGCTDECLACYDEKIAELSQQLAECQAERDGKQIAYDEIYRIAADRTQKLYECQAREKVRINALQISELYVPAGHEHAQVAKAIALPSDSTALDAMKKQWQREALLEAIAVSNETAQKLGIHQPTAFMYEVVLSKMAKDLET